MAKYPSRSDFAFEKQISDASRDYLKFLTDSDAKLKDQLVDVMLESRENSEIDEILILLAFVRNELADLDEDS